MNRKPRHERREGIRANLENANMENQRLLREAVEAGFQIRRSEQERDAQAKKAKELAEAAQFKKDVQRIRDELESSGILFESVTKAVAKGLDHFQMYGSPALAKAIETFDGFQARYACGNDYINSDEVKEFWETVTVTWRT